MKRLTTLLVLLCSACVDQVGPFVRDVTPNEDGSIRVNYCYVELHHGGFGSTTLQQGECWARNVHAKQDKAP